MEEITLGEGVTQPLGRKPEISLCHAHPIPSETTSKSPNMSTQPASLVLASNSASRCAMLNQAGLAFEISPAKVDEEAVRASLSAEGVSPRNQADALAELKAKKVAEKYETGLVIGSDQILAFDGVVLGKAEDPDILRDQLSRFSGKSHDLYSAAVIYEEYRPVWRAISHARLTMRPLSPQFISDYVARNWDEVRWSVGGYHIEAEGIRLFSSIQGSYHAILGLPLIELLSYLSTREVIST